MKEEILKEEELQKEELQKEDLQSDIREELAKNGMFQVGTETSSVLADAFKNATGINCYISKETDFAEAMKKANGINQDEHSEGSTQMFKNVPLGELSDPVETGVGVGEGKAETMFTKKNNNEIKVEKLDDNNFMEEDEMRKEEMKHDIYDLAIMPMDQVQFRVNTKTFLEFISTKNNHFESIFRKIDNYDAILELIKFDISDIGKAVRNTKAISMENFTNVTADIAKRINSIKADSIPAIKIPRTSLRRKVIHGSLNTLNETRYEEVINLDKLKFLFLNRYEIKENSFLTVYKTTDDYIHLYLNVSEILVYILSDILKISKEEVVEKYSINGRFNSTSDIWTIKGTRKEIVAKEQSSKAKPKK